jgi:hypothetical protein
VLSGIGEAIKQKLVIDDAVTKTLRGVFAVFVEQMQNMIRYSAEMTMRNATKPPPPSDAEVLREIRYGILTIGRENGDYVVHTGNLIQRSDVEGCGSA